MTVATLRGAVRGLGGLRAALAAAADQLRAGLPAAQEAAAVVVATRAAQVTAPRRTGFLAAHTTADQGTVVSTAPYARPVHAANPFVTRALLDTTDRVVSIYADQLAQLVATIERK